MAKPRRKTTFRVFAYDGDHKTRDLLAYASGGHRIADTYASKEEAVTALQAWFTAHTVRDHREAKAHIEEVSARGDVYTLEVWRAGETYVPNSNGWRKL